jgi:hypothetical protein
MNIGKHHIILFGLVAFLLSGCIKAPPECPMNTLMLEESLFPKDTYFEPLVSPIAEYPKSSFAQGFSLELPNEDVFTVDAGNYRIIHWGSNKSAKEEFDQGLKFFFLNHKIDAWKTPKEATFTSAVADNYYTACGISFGYYNCKTIAVYGKYSVWLGVSISEKGLTYSIYNKLLQAIDDKMATCAE